MEELLRHIDEDQPLDAARVEHLHRNVKPDGDQKWVFVPPGADEAPAESQMDDLGSTSTTPATVTDHPAAAPPTRTLTRDMDMSESRTGSTTKRGRRGERSSLWLQHREKTWGSSTPRYLQQQCQTQRQTYLHPVLPPRPPWTRQKVKTENPTTRSNNPRWGLRPNSMKERCLAPRTTRTASPKPLQKHQTWVEQFPTTNLEATQQPIWKIRHTGTVCAVEHDRSNIPVQMRQHPSPPSQKPDHKPKTETPPRQHHNNPHLSSSGNLPGPS